MIDKAIRTRKHDHYYKYYSTICHALFFDEREDNSSFVAFLRTIDKNRHVTMYMYML